MPDAPLILTVSLDTASQNFFNDLRKRHFPPERNYLDAHLTLFHHLPPNEIQITDAIRELAGTRQPLTIQATNVTSIGNGVAYKLESDKLVQIHQQLQSRWQPWLIPQDKQKLWPHITVQNKVDAARAKALKAALEQDFQPFEIVGTGLALWEYLGGPWKLVEVFDFKR